MKLKISELDFSMKMNSNNEHDLVQSATFSHRHLGSAIPGASHLFPPVSGEESKKVAENEKRKRDTAENKPCQV